MNEKVNDLVNVILEWWEIHEYDVNIVGGEEYNRYPEDPEFVVLAKELKEEL
jgi:hypothetical protein